MIDTNSPLLPPIPILPADQNTPSLRKRGRSQSVGQISIEQRVFAVTSLNDRTQIDTPFIYTGSTSSEVRRHGEMDLQEIEEAFQSNLTRVDEVINKVLDKVFDQQADETFENRIRNLTGLDRMCENIDIHANETFQQLKEELQKEKSGFNLKMSQVIQIFHAFLTQTIQKIKDLWDQIKGPLKEGLIFAMGIVQNIKFGKLGSLGFIKIGALFSIKYQVQNQNTQPASPSQLHIQGNYVASQTIIFNGLPPAGTTSEIVLHCSGCGLHTTHSLTSSPSLPQIAAGSN